MCIRDRFLAANEHEPEVFEYTDPEVDIVYVSEGDIVVDNFDLYAYCGKVSFRSDCGPMHLNEHAAPRTVKVFKVFKTTKIEV